MNWKDSQALSYSFLVKSEGLGVMVVDDSNIFPFTVSNRTLEQTDWHEVLAVVETRCD